MKLHVSEVFGPTLQGEGPLSGRRASFIRLGLCNLDCLNCDTPYTWDWIGRTGKVYDRKSLDRCEPEALVNMVAAHGTDLVIITGGEPLVQRTNLHELMEQLVAAGFEIQVETNGTISPDQLLSIEATWVVSPKGEAMPTSQPAIRKTVLREFAGCDTAHLKVVCATGDDVAAARDLADELDWPLDRVWVMPEGIDPNVLVSRSTVIADAAIAKGLNLSTRLHVLAWGNVRGR